MNTKHQQITEAIEALYALQGPAPTVDEIVEDLANKGLLNKLPVAEHGALADFMYDAQCAGASIEKLATMALESA